MLVDPLVLILQVTGGELLFNPGSNEPTGVDTLYLVVGQSFSVSTFDTKLVLGIPIIPSTGLKRSLNWQIRISHHY